VVPRAELAQMRNPSMAGLMTRLMGNWGDAVIAVGLVISVCGAYLSWTIMAAEVPLIAAQQGAFPRSIARQNRHNAPAASLWLTNGSIQLCLILIALTGANYNNLLTIASEMILVPYLLVGLYLIKVVRGQHKPLAMATGIGASLYGIWLLYASGPLHLMMSVVLYTPGLLLFLFARRGGRAEFALTSLERIAMGLLIAATLPAVWQLTT
jgi:arginine:ornithine antiporter/lysine permease